MILFLTLFTYLFTRTMKVNSLWKGNVIFVKVIYQQISSFSFWCIFLFFYLLIVFQFSLCCFEKRKNFSAKFLLAFHLHYFPWGIFRVSCFYITDYFTCGFFSFFTRRVLVGFGQMYTGLCLKRAICDENSRVLYRFCVKSRSEFNLLLKFSSKI